MKNRSVNSADEIFKVKLSILVKNPGAHFALNIEPVRDMKPMLGNILRVYDLFENRTVKNCIIRIILDLIFCLARSGKHLIYSHF